MSAHFFQLVFACCLTAAFSLGVHAADAPTSPDASSTIVAKPDLFQPLTEPPCSYCSTQQRKGLILPHDRVIAWLRGAHNGGAVPLRHFLSGPRVINDTYGLFFYDPDGGYVAAYKKDYGYSFYGWRDGVMVVKGPDGSLWSALSGRAFSGPKQGQRLQRIPSLVTEWDYWLMLHPESTAYDLFDGKKYKEVSLPTETHPEARRSMGKADPRLGAMTNVLGSRNRRSVQSLCLGRPSRTSLHQRHRGRYSNLRLLVQTDPDSGRLPAGSSGKDAIVFGRSRPPGIGADGGRPDAYSLDPCRTRRGRTAKGPGTAMGQLNPVPLVRLVKRVSTERSLPWHVVIEDGAAGTTPTSWARSEAAGQG